MIWTLFVVFALILTILPLSAYSEESSEENLPVECNAAKCAYFGIDCCQSGQTCNKNGQCISSCTPNCNSKTCGSDGCGGSCGTCPDGQTCSNGNCVSIFCPAGSCTPGTSDCSSSTKKQCILDYVSPAGFSCGKSVDVGNWCLAYPSTPVLMPDCSCAPPKNNNFCPAGSCTPGTSDCSSSTKKQCILDYVSPAGFSCGKWVDIGNWCLAYPSTPVLMPDCTCAPAASNTSKSRWRRSSSVSSTSRISSRAIDSVTTESIVTFIPSYEAIASSYTSASSRASSGTRTSARASAATNINSNTNLKSSSARVTRINTGK